MVTAFQIWMFCPSSAFTHHTRLFWMHDAMPPPPTPEKAALLWSEVSFKRILETPRHSDKRNTLYMYHSWGTLVRRFHCSACLPDTKGGFFLVDVDFLLNCLYWISRQILYKWLQGPWRPRREQSTRWCTGWKQQHGFTSRAISFQEATSRVFH